jgi:hypothetical protein
MNTDRPTGEIAGAKYFNWAIIAGAAALIAVAFNGFVLQPTHAAKAPNESVVVSASAHHA